MIRFSDADKQKCAERELALRKGVYPKWVQAGRMKAAIAEREIAIMESIAEDYRERQRR